MSNFKPLRQAFLEMLKDRLDILPKGSDVTVAVTVHGIPGTISNMRRGFNWHHPIATSSLKK